MSKQITKASNYLASYKIGSVVSLAKMEQQPTFYEIVKTGDENTKKMLYATIIAILTKYLSLNIKGRSITDKDALLLIAQHIVNNHHSLELQEIEHILKSGVMGLYGELYNDISIDTICGVNGWIAKYKSQERQSKKVIKEAEDKTSVISITEFYKRNPELKLKSDRNALLINSSNNNCDWGDVIKAYELVDKEIDIVLEQKESKTKYENSGMSEHINYKQFEKMHINNLIQNILRNVGI